MEADPRPALTRAIEMRETQGTLTEATTAAARRFAAALPCDLSTETWARVLDELERAPPGG